MIEELRGAGAEAMQFGSVRVSTSTSFTASDAASRSTDSSPAGAVHGAGDRRSRRRSRPRWRSRAGCAATVRAAGGTASISQQAKIDITALRTLPTPRYAKPAGR